VTSLPYFLIGVGELLWANRVGPVAASLLVWAGLATNWIGFVHLFHRPGWIGKQHFPRLALWVLLPYFLVARGVVRIARPAWFPERQKVVDGLWIGGWPSEGAPGMAQLDLTAEQPRRGTAAAYRCIPMLDGATPRVSDLRIAIQQVREWRAQGLDVLIHCAYGHGRSAAVCVGALVALGFDPDVETALSRLRTVRPRARLHRFQCAAVKGALHLQ